MKKYFNQFNKRLQQLGLTLRDVDADGNCLFRAIADQLTGNEENYNKYRSMAIRSLQKNRKFFSDFLPEGSTFNEYTKRMSEDGIWGGHLELQALSNTLQIDIVVHTLDNYYIIKHIPIKTCWSSFKEKIHLYFNKKQVPTQKQIHIAFHSGKKIINHYQSVRLIHDNTNKPAKQPSIYCELSEQSTTDESY
ncbi:unnamed protein product (macronuclear) [Paramecium tetraurelia]|uniref:OTU domain-containing protein n=1 Tax=Paramecium tetraurelia TaxID=5888 RepID=A0C1A8_PARTE|nr:uncharacterized protein GSPATT00034051001 [Paramecium tetraurelia]CAK64575.1 unnamed protein product [Paramecium tetraurelia]|eukprot:XP_001431973.1 hypothetical protein (macronuclear) [Paramecium tetraurelia strain d4-2]